MAFPSYAAEPESFLQLGNRFLAAIEFDESFGHLAAVAWFGRDKLPRAIEGNQRSFKLPTRSLEPPQFVPAFAQVGSHFEGSRKPFPRFVCLVLLREQTTNLERREIMVGKECVNLSPLGSCPWQIMNCFQEFG